MRYREIFIIYLISLIFKKEAFSSSDGATNSCESVVSRCIEEILPAAEDILPVICQYLSLQDLHRSRSVCQLFKEAADVVLRQRGPEIKSLQVKQSFPEQPIPELVYRSLNIRPQVALFFTDDESSINFYRSISDEIFARFLPELPSGIQIIHTKGLTVLLDQKPIKIGKNHALGLFLPHSQTGMTEVRTFAIRQYWAKESGTKIDTFIQNIFNVPNTYLQQNHFGLILLNMQFRVSVRKPYEYTYWVVSKSIRETIGTVPGTFALWGSSVEWLKMLNDDSSIIGSFVTQISGPRVKCWSIAINLAVPKSQINNQIAEFRKKIYINSKSIGLALISVGSFDPDKDAIRASKRLRTAFSELKIMSYGVESNMPKYCYNSIGPNQRDAVGPIITYDMYHMCFMVVTYL